MGFSLSYVWVQLFWVKLQVQMDMLYVFVKLRSRLQM
jgi:hypothetical protein